MRKEHAKKEMKLAKICVCNVKKNANSVCICVYNLHLCGVLCVFFFFLLLAKDSILNCDAEICDVMWNVPDESNTHSLEGKG